MSASATGRGTAAPGGASGGATDSAGIDLSLISDHLGFHLRLVQQRVFDEFHRRFSADRLTPARYSVLAVLAANPDARQVAVADALQIKPPNFAVLIATMEADGLVERRADSRNRRANMLRLTPEGQALHARMAPAVREMGAHLERALSAEERAGLFASLRRLEQE